MGKESAVEDGEQLQTAAIRIPTALYHELKTYLAGGEVRPSYAQLALMACQNYPQEVVTTARESLLADLSAYRGPGQAARPTTALSPRFWPDELAEIDSIQQQIDVPRRVRVTRTSVITAALHIAVAKDLGGTSPTGEQP